MKTYTAEQIAAITNGKILCGDPQTEITNIQYDSREIKKGSLFVPIKGAKTDAHKFIEDCFQSGAAATFTEYDAPEGADVPYIKVENTLEALQMLAAFQRKQMNVKLIGVTGSVGKTSTKEMIAAALSCGLDVMKTQGNRNSQIGMPMTMFDIAEHNEAAVIEMGMSEFGEMDRLSDIARPDMAVMTNIGKAHIENLKTQENILAEKFKITKYFTKDSILFLNGDDKLLRQLHNKQFFRTVTFGLSEDNDYYADEIRTFGFSTSFMCVRNGKKTQLNIPALGVHIITNALAAFAVGAAMGLDEQTIARGLACYKNAPMRQQMHELKDFLLIDDSYNASPEATKASLDVLKKASSGKTIAVLADMLELGDEAPTEHYNVGKYLADIGIDTLITIGSMSENTATGARENGCERVTSFENNGEAYQYLKTVIEKDCTILVKGSRSMHTDVIVSNILADYK